MIGKEEKKLKMAKEAATAEFENIVDAFGFNVSMEAVKREMRIEKNNTSMYLQQEIVEVDSFIQKIMKGAISFDEERTEIVYKLKSEIKTGENGSVRTKEFRFGRFTRGIQKSIKEDSSGKLQRVNLTEINFGSLKDDKADIILMAMTGISDVGIINELSIPEYNDLRMVAGYFFN